jgi:hypothetical protein
MSTGATTSVGIRVDGVAGQTADLQAWRDSGGTVLSSINSAGRLFVNTTTNYFASIADSCFQIFELRSQFD